MENVTQFALLVTIFVGLSVHRNLEGVCLRVDFDSLICEAGFLFRYDEYLLLIFEKNYAEFCFS